MGKQQKGTNPEPATETNGGFSDFLQSANKGLDPLRPIPQPGYKQDKKVHDPAQTRNLDINKYRPYIENIDPDDPELELKRAQGQTGIEQAGAALGQFGAQFLGGASMALGTSLDLEQTINVVKGTEQEYSNLLYDFGKKVIEAGKETMPIYQERTGEFSPSDPGWWAQMFADTGLSAGIMAESLVETAAITALTEGTGIGAGLANMTKNLRNIKGLKSLIGAGEAGASMRTAATTFGVINRHHEGVMEAADAFETEYTKLKAKGLSERDAKDAAAQAASATYVGNLPLLALDIMQFRAMTFNPMSGGATGGLIENVLGAVKNPGLAKGIGMGFGIASEGGEEFWQYLVQEEAQHYADGAVGLADNSTLKERFKKYTAGGEIWNATASGIMGGALLGGASKLYQKSRENGSRQVLDQEYEQFVNNISGIGTEMVNEIRKADEAGDEAKANHIRRGMGIQKALHAVHLDNLKDSNSAFNAYTSYMQEALNAAESNDTERLTALGLEDQQDFLKANVPNYIKDARDIQAIYNDVKQYNERDAVIPITYRRFLQNNLSNESMQLDARIAAEESTMPDLINLSNPGRAINDAQINISLAEAKVRGIRSQLSGDNLSQIEREGLNSSLMNLNFLIEKNKEIIETNREAAESLPSSQKQFDNDILESANRSVGLQRLKEQKIDIDSQLAKVRKELGLWTNPEFQKKSQRQKLYDIISKSETVEELDNAQKTMATQGLWTNDLNSKYTNKRKELVARQEAEALKNNSPIEASTGEQASGLSEFLAQQESPSQVTQPTQESPFGDVLGLSQEEFEAMISPERQEVAADLFNTGAGIMDMLTQAAPSAEERVAQLTEGSTPITNFNQLANGDRVIQNSDKKIGTISEVTPSGAVLTFDNGGKLTLSSLAMTDLSKLVTTPTTPLQNSEVSAQATIVNDQTLFEPAPLSDNISEAQQEGIRARLSDYYTSLTNDLGAKPTFKQLVEDMINNTSTEQVDRNWNLITLGWKLNNYANTNFDKVYNDLFGTRKSKAIEFFDFAQESLATEQEFRQEQEELTNETELAEAPPIQVEETETGEKVYKNLGQFQTVESTLKFAHLSQTYNEVITQDGKTIIVERTTNTDELNQNEFVDSRDLMNPNLYAPGTKLEVRIPENIDNILLTNWSDDFSKKTSQTYAQWVSNRDTNSDEVIGRMPLIIYNGDKGVAFIHDVEWYNPINVGYGELPAKQKQIIAESRAELMAFRKAVLANGGNLSIIVTEKRPGTKIVIPTDKPLITIQEANPDAMIGFPNDLGNIVVGKTVIPFDNLLNANELERGHKYDVRQSGLMPDGSKQYFAAKVHYGAIDAAAKGSIIQAIRVYMSQYDTKQELSSAEDIKNLRERVKSNSKLDLFDQADFESYLNLFIQTYKGKAKTNIAIAEDMNSRDEIISGTPWMAISEGRLVFGIKGVKLSNSESNGFTIYMHPQNMQKENSATFASMAVSNLQRIFKADYLGAMKQNLSQEQLVSNTPVTLIDTASVNESPVDYNTYLKTKLKTNLRSIKLEDGTYTSFTQPVIHYTYEEQVPIESPVLENNTQPISVIDIIQQSVSEVTGTPVQPTEQELIKSITDVLGEFETLGLTPEAMQALRNLSTGSDSLFDPDYARLTDDIVMSVKKKLTKVEDLDTIDRNTVVQFIANQVMTKINPQERNVISKKQLIGEINQSFSELIGPKVALVDAKIGALEQLQATGKYQLEEVISQLGNLRANAEILKKNWNFLINEAFTDYIEKFTGISVTMSKDQKTIDVEVKDEEAPQDLTEQEDDQQEFNIETNDQREKDYTKESIEDNGKNSVSYLTKRFLSQIPSYDKSGNPKKGYMGITTYPGFDYYYDAIGKILSSPVIVDSNLESILVRLQQHSEGKPWVNEVIRKLQESDEQLQNAFIYNFSRETLSMKFVMYSFDSKSGAYRLKVYDTNANEILRVIQTQWRENFKQSKLVKVSGDSYIIDVIHAQRLLDQFTSWTTPPSLEVAKAWLAEFGLELSTDSMQELVTKGYYVTENNKPVVYPYAKMFQRSANTNGAFGRLAETLAVMVRPNTNLDFQENDLINPFTDTSGILGKLAYIESKFSLNVTTNSFRDGSKSIFGYTPSKFATAFLKELKTNPNVLKDKRQISFDQNSYLLDLIESDPDFTSKFGIDHLGINAFKELGKKLYQDNEINSLADADHELVKLGMFQDNRQGEVKSKTFNGLKLRIGRMFLPTMSDKKTMLDISTAVLDLKTKDFTINDDNSVTINDDIKEFIFSQTIEPELKRIISHHKRAKQLGIHPNGLNNQKGYNLAAQIFNMIPAMNNVMFKGQTGDIRLIEYLADAASMINTENYQALKDNIKEQTNALIDDMYNRMADEKIASWDSNGYFEKNSSNQITQVKYLNQSYMSGLQGDLTTQVKTAALDFTINSAITNANLHMLLAGDVANYSQDKAFKGRFVLDENKQPIPYKPINNSVYADMMANVIGVNLGKRLALLIAPGSTIAQSKNDKYVQLFLQDRVSMSENINFLIELYHGKEALEKAMPLIEANNAKALMDMFPDLDAYFAIESTDAQEYTTTKEHLDVLYRQGRVSVEQYQDFISKINTQREAEAAGRPIPEDAILSDEQLKVIFQPIKPVYTGQMNDTANDVSRMVYVKSSSFPLLPQVTSAFPALNGLRKKMEELEVKTGKNVRASYDTANKVGAVLGMNQLEIWDTQGNFIEDSINVDDIATKLAAGNDTSALVMNREFFRIQQDVPFKSAKKSTQDTITLGTQMMKLMFGDGVGQIKESIFNLDGRKVSGRQLMDHYNAMFNNWIAAEKTNLYNSLGIDQTTGEATDKAKTVQKLQNILQDEARKRGYPKQDIEALELDSNGDLNANIQFTIPLWLSPNSNRYEALLNAMVTSRLLNLSLPGASMVAGSEEGFKIVEGTENIDQSKVIFTSNWTGELKGASNTNLAQVLVPSKFRDRDGKLLNLFKKEEGTYVYLTETESGTYRLKEDMIDPAMLTSSTFRIPTSSHVSMAEVEIVGFLPVESGDLIIVPKNFTKQKGLDYDVDKENMYMLHHFIDADNKIQPVSNNDYGVTAETIADEIASSEAFLNDLRIRSQENRDLIDNYEAELEITEGFDRKYVVGLIKDLKQDVSKGDIKGAVSVLKELKDLQIKLYQNEIIKSYSSVLSSKDERIQKKINKVLSTDFAETQANLIDAMIKKTEDNSGFTILSDEYQKYKMSLGAAGKLGIGVYSNYVVFHSLSQQTRRPIRLTTVEFIEGQPTKVPYILNIGGIESDGRLGKIMTLDGARSITDVNAERQNTATDNEKLQIMGKTNVNEITINVDALLSIMGFDQTSAVIDGKSQPVSLPYMLMSQPIIRDYVAEMRKTSSNIAGYNPNSKADVYSILRGKYFPDFVPGDMDKDLLRRQMTGQKLVDAILDNGADGDMQKAVLDLFLELNDFGDQMRGLQSKLNIQRQGLGKSIFEMIDKYNNVAKLESSGSFEYISDLVGDYISGDLYYGYEREELIAQGYTIFDDNTVTLPFAVKPTTVTGSLIVHSAKAGYELWSDYFPHQNPVVTKTINDIMKIISTEETSETKKIQLQHEIFGEMKKYLFSSNQTGIFKGDPQQERDRLFFDRLGVNQSLAGYLNMLVKSEHPAKDMISTNKLISRFVYNLEQGILPSVIKYDNSRSEDFNEEYKYLALVELMDKNVNLIPYNGQPYTSRMLAKDLITYSYLQGGIQEAIEFVKYVPVPYLKEMGFADATQLWQRAAKGELFVNQNGDKVDVWSAMLGTSIQEDDSSTGRFVMQFLQHNPQRLPKVTEESFSSVIYDKEAKLSDVLSFIPKLTPEEITPFVSVYNKAIPKGKPKFQVYQFDGKRYNRISTLGVFGMSEYSNKSNDVVSLVDKHYPQSTLIDKIEAVQQQPQIQEQFYALRDNNLQKTLDMIIADNIPAVSEVTKALLPYIKNDVEIKVETPLGATVARAEFRNGVIRINPSYLANPNTSKEMVATTVLHEYIHALTSTVINQHFDPSGVAVASPLPANMQRLQRLFNEVQRTLGPELTQFSEWYAKNPGQTRGAEDRILYAGMNIHEFVAMVMSEPDIQRRMAQIPYMKTDKNLLQQFVEAIKKVLIDLGINLDSNNVTAEAMNTVFEILEEQKQVQPVETPSSMTIFGQVLTPTDEDLGKLLDNEDLRENNDDKADEANFLEPSTLQEDNLDENCIF